MSIVGGERLEAQKLEQLADYAAYLPGLSMDTGGNPSFDSVLLRGIYPLTNASAVTFYIDDAPVGTNGLYAAWATPDLIPYDLERVEVQRGPQGTLGGASDESGVIRYVLNKPNLNQFEARAGADVSTTHYASKPGTSLQGMVNVPIIQDTLALRVSAYDTYTPGSSITSILGRKTSTSSDVTAGESPCSGSPRNRCQWSSARSQPDQRGIPTPGGLDRPRDRGGDGDANIYKVKKTGASSNRTLLSCRPTEYPSISTRRQFTGTPFARRPVRHILVARWTPLDLRYDTG